MGSWSKDADLHEFLTPEAYPCFTTILLRNCLYLDTHRLRKSVKIYLTLSSEF